MAEESMLDILKRAVGYLSLHGYEAEAKALSADARALLAAGASEGQEPVGWAVREKHFPDRLLFSDETGDKPSQGDREWAEKQGHEYVALYTDPSAEIAALREAMKGAAVIANASGAEIKALRERIAGMEKDAEKTPVEFIDVERILKEGDGAWQSCSGCHETEDGHPVGEFPFSRFLKCELGAGCSECGGLGAVYHDWSGYDLADIDASIAEEKHHD